MKIKNFVVGIGNLFEGNIKLYKVEAEDKYNAVKKAMVDSCLNEESKEYEIEWQNSEDYPESYEELRACSGYEDFPFDVIEI